VFACNSSIVSDLATRWNKWCFTHDINNLYYVGRNQNRGDQKWDEMKRPAEIFTKGRL